MENARTAIYVRISTNQQKTDDRSSNSWTSLKGASYTKMKSKVNLLLRQKEILSDRNLVLEYVRVLRIRKTGQNGIDLYDSGPISKTD